MGKAPPLIMSLTAVDGSVNGLGVKCECRITRGEPVTAGWVSPTRFTWAAGVMGPRGGVPDVIANDCKPRRCQHRNPCGYHIRTAADVMQMARVEFNQEDP